MLHTDKTCTSNDEMYLFKVQDYTTQLVGRLNVEGGFYYIQRGDGEMYKYNIDRHCLKLMKKRRENTEKRIRRRR